LNDLVTWHTDGIEILTQEAHENKNCGPYSLLRIVDHMDLIPAVAGSDNAIWYSSLSSGSGGPPALHRGSAIWAVGQGRYHDCDL